MQRDDVKNNKFLTPNNAHCLLLEFHARNGQLCENNGGCPITMCMLPGELDCVCDLSQCSYTKNPQVQSEKDPTTDYMNILNLITVAS